MTHPTPLPAWCECRVWLGRCSACANAVRALRNALAPCSWQVWRLCFRHRFTDRERTTLQSVVQRVTTWGELSLYPWNDFPCVTQTLKRWDTFLLSDIDPLCNYNNDMQPKPIKTNWLFFLYTNCSRNSRYWVNFVDADASVTWHHEIISSHNVDQYLITHLSGTTYVEPVLWMLMAWCFNTRVSAAIVLTNNLIRLLKMSKEAPGHQWPLCLLDTIRVMSHEAYYVI